MNRLNTNVEVNIIPLGSYDCLIHMDWLEKNHVVLECYNETITCIYEEGKKDNIQGIPRIVVFREISSIQLKRISGRDAKFLQHIWKRKSKIKWKTLKTIRY
jgi:hypothetical protein